MEFYRRANTVEKLCHEEMRKLLRFCLCVISPRVKRFISGLLQDDITAEDFAQDILLKLWQKREEMAKIENLNAYLYRTSGMLCTSIYDIYFW